MNIKCPKCQSRANLPDSKEGAKVKCGNCGRIYVAARIGAKRVHTSGVNTGAVIGVGVAVVLLLAVVILRKSAKGEHAQAAETNVAAPAPAKKKEAWVDPLSWEGPAVQFAVRLHEAVLSLHAPSVRRRLDSERIWRERRDAGVGEGEPENYATLSATERDDLANRYAQELLAGDGHRIFADWKPYDGEVLGLDDNEAIVRLSLAARSDDAGLERRTIDWKLARDSKSGEWRAYYWKRSATAEERAAAKRARLGYEKKVLSDGSLVNEREPEPLEHFVSTPEELRVKIDELYAVMIDLDQGRDGTRARDALVELGRPVIPVLLTGLYETPLDSDDNAIIANLIVTGLRDVTNEYFGYKPQTLIGSAVGTSEERRQSAIKQWFAWWHRNKKNFYRKADEVDGLEEFIQLTDSDKAWLERHKD